MDRDYALIRQLPLRMAAEKKLHSEFWVNQMINDCRRLSTDSRISFDRALRETAKQLESYAKQRQAEEEAGRYGEVGRVPRDVSLSSGKKKKKKKKREREREIKRYR